MCEHAAAGVILPKLGIFALIDALTQRQCQLPSHSIAHPLGSLIDPTIACPRAKVAAEGHNDCTREGGVCVVVSDGFYPLSFGAACCGLVMWLLFRRMLPKLDLLQKESWRAKAVSRQL